MKAWQEKRNKKAAVKMEKAAEKVAEPLTPKAGGDSTLNERDPLTNGEPYLHCVATEQEFKGSDIDQAVVEDFLNKLAEIATAIAAREKSKTI